MTWLKDDKGNKSSVEYFGSEELAKKALDSLVDCENCTNCSDCFDCSDCSDCFRCSFCSDCFRCCDCFFCSGCSRCSDCFRCYKATGAKADIAEVPTIPNIHKAVYEAVSQPNALNMSDWHTCETTHSRAGWVVFLAGESGKKLESKSGTLLSTMKIYDASAPGYLINPCRFFDSNKDAMDDMKRMAREE